MSNVFNYAGSAAVVLQYLREAGYAETTVHLHRLCYDAFEKHLAEVGQPFSMESAIDWLDGQKTRWKHQTYLKYRLALYRFAQYLENGNVERGLECCSGIFYAYHDSEDAYVKLPERFKVIFNEFRGMLVAEMTTAYQYLAGCKEFLLFLSELNCSSPYEITIDNLFEYSNRLREGERKNSNNHKHVSGVNRLLRYFQEQEYIPRCYLSVIYAEQESRPERLDSPAGTAFHPSKELDAKLDEFMEKLEIRAYNRVTEAGFRDTLTSFFKFLEVNHMDYSPEICKLWISNTASEMVRNKRHKVMSRFAEFIQTGSISDVKKFAQKPKRIDTLPEWSRSVVDGFLAQRRREGWAEKTIGMSQAASVRFFGFLDRKGVTCPSGITSPLVKEFHDTDQHSTSASRVMYSSSVRMLLEYMAERELVPATLSLAISTKCAPTRKIVSILSSEFETALYDYRKNAKTPLELRNAAMFMIGLRMGLRASDIVNLKINDLDMKNKKLSIIQTKTRRAITLPIPTEVGNSIYRYVTEGRPQTGEMGAGYVFVGHKSPYSVLSYAVCKKALDEVLALYGFALGYGQGFHITRKTFATRLLTSRTEVDTIADALGHATRATVDSYLARDEESMRLCPLPFSIGGTK